MHILGGMKLDQCPEDFHLKGNECVRDCTHPTAANPTIMKLGENGICVSLEPGDKIFGDGEATVTDNLFKTEIDGATVFYDVCPESMVQEGDICKYPTKYN